MAGRPEESVQLIAVTKFHAIESIREAASLGLRHFAESRIQEAGGKLPGLASLGEWHFIGHLQTNKARPAAELFQVVQSVDSLRLAQKLAEAAQGMGKTLRIFAQVNISAEDQKHGFSLASAPDEIPALQGLPGLHLEGLMGMASAGPDQALIHRQFAALRGLRDSLRPGLGALRLSMGMSQDFETAVEEGADLVRIGTALFEGTA
jgi:pyridoxal phosphate enzyme (YggS family)